MDNLLAQKVGGCELVAELTANLAAVLRSFVQERQLGRVYIRLSFQISSEPVLLTPRISFVQVSWLALGREKSGPFQGAPTLAVEIISPRETWPDVEDKVALYLESGTKVVWLIEPERRHVTTRTLEGPNVLFDGDFLEGPEILPGFKIP